MPTLEWIGKKSVLNHHQDVPFHLLKRDPKLSVGDPDSGNLLVQGDNLVALKALLPYYAKRVKCVYIDPPYNTGEEKWIYNDAVNSAETREWLGKVVGREGDDFSRHDKWLCFMYPRLKMLKEFLRDDGVFLISIDDNSFAFLRMLMNEVFGPNRFVATVVWQKRYSRENRAIIGDVHEYILVYAMNPLVFKEVRNKQSPNEKQEKVYRNPNNDPRGRWRPIPMTAQAGHATPDQFYEIVSPSGKVFTPPKGRCWGLAEDTFRRLEAEGRIYFGKKGDSQPNVIRYLSEVEGFVPWTWWPHDEVGNTDGAKKEMLSLFPDEEPFDTPKPESLMKRIIEIATNEGELVLDAFAGSGTTGAVAHKMNRRWIMIEVERFCETLAATRCNQVVKGEDPGGITEEVMWKGGGGFSYCTVGERLFDDGNAISDTVKFSDLAAHVFFIETGTPLPKPSTGKTPLLGFHNGTAVYLLYNGVLKDKKPKGGNVLTRAVLDALPPHDGPKVVYGTSCLIGAERLRRENVVFRQIPYEVRVG